MDTDQTRTEPVSKEVTVDAPVERVWKAITDKDEMKHWYFDLANFKPEVGFEFQFTGGTDERKYVHLCKILEVIPGKKLKHSWKYEGYPGESFVTFELFNDGGKTKVKLMHEGLESFGNKGDFAKENFVAGWNDIIGRSLKEYVEKK